MKDRLEKRKKELEEEFTKLNEAREGLVEQRKELDKNLSQIQVRQVQLQGSYAEVEELLKDSDKDSRDHKDVKKKDK